MEPERSASIVLLAIIGLIEIVEVGTRAVGVQVEGCDDDHGDANEEGGDAGVEVRVGKGGGGGEEGAGAEDREDDLVGGEKGVV